MHLHNHGHNGILAPRHAEQCTHSEFALNSYEPYPDHSTIQKAFKKLGEDYLDSILENSAYLCA